MRNFKQLKIWQDGMEITRIVYKITSFLPAEEKFGLVSQMRRAAISIPSNIAEGCSRTNNSELFRFVEIALGSAFELQTQLEISVNLGFINPENHIDTFKKLTHLQISMNNYRQFLKNNPNK
jgi:four helix bundle protein